MKIYDLAIVGFGVIGTEALYKLKKLASNKYEIVNIDSTIVLRQPKISPYTLKIKKNLALLMGITENQISVKATTTDGLGFVGSSEGWSAIAIATVIKTE